MFAQRRGYDYAIIIQDHTIKLVKSIAILPADIVMDVVVIVWTLNFAEMLTLDFYWAVRKFAIEISREMDQQHASGFAVDGDGSIGKGPLE